MAASTIRVTMSITIIIAALLLISTASAGIISKRSIHPRVVIKCGSRPVADALVDFREFENDHHKHHHKHLQKRTDANGNLYFKDVETFNTLRGSVNDFKIAVNDNCMKEKVDYTCNLSYSHFEVSIKSLPFVDDQVLLLDLTDHSFDVLCI